MSLVLTTAVMARRWRIELGAAFVPSGITHYQWPRLGAVLDNILATHTGCNACAGILGGVLLSCLFQTGIEN